MSKAGKTKSSLTALRNGEGALIDVRSSTIVGTEGQTAIMLNIDLNKAPVPDRRYAADFAGLIYKDDIVKFIFGQEKIDSSSIRSLVIIAMHAPDANKFLQSLGDLRSPTLDEMGTRFNIKKVDLYQISSEPEQTVAMAANLVSAAVSGRAACLDFYSASAFAIAKVVETQQLAVEPVVRIDLPTSYLITIRNSLRELVVDFPPDINGESI
jgi:hypothetical protein